MIKTPHFLNQTPKPNSSTNSQAKICKSATSGWLESPRMHLRCQERSCFQSEPGISSGPSWAGAKVSGSVSGCSRACPGVCRKGAGVSGVPSSRLVVWQRGDDPAGAFGSSSCHFWAGSEASRYICLEPLVLNSRPDADSLFGSDSSVGS